MQFLSKSYGRFLYATASSLDQNGSSKICLSETILAAMIHVCVVCWRAPKEKNTEKAMITYQHESNLADRLIRDL